jgi:hypothetical protein
MSEFAEDLGVELEGSPEEVILLELKLLPLQKPV